MARLQRGIAAVGIMSDGKVKGCLSMPDELTEGDLRENDLWGIWFREDVFSCTRAFAPGRLGPIRAVGHRSGCRLWGENDKEPHLSFISSDGARDLCDTMLCMSGPSPQEPYPTVSEVEAIAAVEDACVRNLRITDCYARLSAAARARIGEGANWCSFATWASRQAGCTIRGEDLGDRLADLVKGEWEARRPLLGAWRFLLRRGLFRPKSRLGRIVRAIHSPFDAFERASEAVAIGNRKVFEEIGYEFARYLDAPELDTFVDALAPGPPPDGQDWLRRAFVHYHEARTETRPSRRAQLMLLANLEIGFHEQARLQPEIQRAMEAAPDTADDLKARLPGIRLLLMVFVAPLASRYRRFARDLTRRAISETLMALRMPDGTLLLGSHLGAAVPSILARIDEPALSELLSAVEPANCEDCGADDWANLPERMHYIFHLFRAYHENPLVFDPPFTAAQTAAIQAGHLPSSRL